MDNEDQIIGIGEKGSLNLEFIDVCQRYLKTNANQTLKLF
jgi:hypothetical protein